MDNFNSKIRKRQIKSVNQLRALEHAYEIDRYPTKIFKQVLANELNINKMKIDKWFQNRRAKDRKNIITLIQRSSEIFDLNQFNYLDSTLNLTSKNYPSSECNQSYPAENMTVLEGTLNISTNEYCESITLDQIDSIFEKTESLSGYELDNYNILKIMYQRSWYDTCYMFEKDNFK